MENQTENRELAIKLTGVKKRYKLGAVGGATLQEDLQSWWAKKRGKPDPNLPIDQDERLVGKSFMALNGIDLTVYKGEALGIIGGNGAGKSTLLKILSRVTSPTEGKVQIWGRIASMLEVGTGFNGEMTGRENIYMNGAILGMTKAEIDAKIEDIIEFSEVRDFIDTPVKRYSSGMYVKLAFSVAAHLDSEIMIMDEVLAVGDMAFQKKCLDKMRDAAKKEDRTVLYVSHNMNTIRQLCDRCVVLEKGKLVFDGNVDSAIQLYMGSDKQLSVVNDCDYPRKQEYDLDGNYYILNAIFLGKKVPIFKDNELINLSVDYRITKRKSDRLAIRTSVMLPDGRVVGQATSLPILNTKVGINKVSFAFDINTLAPGKYILKLVLYGVNEYGAHENYDIVDSACAFEKEQTGNNNMIWNPSWWGYLKFPELKILEGD